MNFDSAPYTFESFFFFFFFLFNLNEGLTNDEWSVTARTPCIHFIKVQVDLHRIAHIDRRDRQLECYLI